MYRLKCYILFVVSLVVLSCENEYYSSIPSMLVQYEMNVLTEDPSFVPTSTCAYKIIKEKRYLTDYIGFGGLLLYVGMDMRYHAFDLACPKCLNLQRTVEVDGIYAVCPICGEHYDLSYGYAVPSMWICEEPLLKYRCEWDGTKLTVRN